MKLIILHGPPSSGKYTIAKELELLVGSKTFHNHLTIDVVKPFLEFDSDEFWDLLYKIRLDCFKQFARLDSELFVFTWCYDHPEDFGFYQEIETSILAEGSEVVPVFLKCRREELDRRVGASLRKKMGKVSEVESLQKRLEKWNCIPIPGENCITLITDKKTPIQCAQEIVEILRLSDNKRMQLDRRITTRFGDR